LKQKGLGSKPNAAQPVETEDIEKIGLQVQSAFKILALFSIWYGGTMSHT